MFTGLKALFGSKKFWLTIIGSAITAGMHYAGAPDTLVYTVGGLFGTGVAAQGVADHGQTKS